MKQTYVDPCEDISDSLTAYWNTKYSKLNDVWGIHPSKAALTTYGLLLKSDMSPGKMVDLGCGYGRDTVFFAKNGFDVIGIDISSKGIDMARELFPEAAFVCRNFPDESFENASFTYIYANFLFHLIPDQSRRMDMIAECFNILESGGILCASLSSKTDQDYVTGDKISEHLVKNKRNVLKVFYDESLINREFHMFGSLNIHPFNEDHTHDTPHSHENFLVIAKK